MLVQVKHWNAYKVPHNEVHQLIGLMVNARADAATLVTSSEFTNAAIEAATRNGLAQLIDGAELRTMLGSPLKRPAIDAPLVRLRFIRSDDSFPTVDGLAA
ncbi:restriction endonuclease [Luteimonas sp. SMYT11W]|uniref:Restriction endonuclease n=1 Tax=Luteimonas flava TaxID=3115822 RepID=A0ABU7WBU5_9GAMM